MRLISTLEKGDLKSLFTLDKHLICEAGECGLRSLYILAGAINDNNISSKLLSYEGPFGVGYGIMEFTPSSNKNADLYSELLKDKNKENERRIKEKKGTIIDTGENILLKPSTYKIVLATDITKVVKKNEEIGKVEYKVELDYIDGNRKDNIGRLQVFIDNVKYQDYQLDFENEVSKGNFWDLLRTIIKSIL